MVRRHGPVVFDTPESCSDLAGFESWRKTVGLISRDSAASALGREVDQEEVVSRRLANIEDAAARAQRVGGGVVVW